ncbi:hypothetical protein JCM11491_004150 [Sporobolomyces phaffii]
MAMAASQSPAPSAPPSSFDHSRENRDFGLEDMFPPSSTSSTTEYDDLTDSPISTHHRTTYSSSEGLHARYGSSREDLYSEFGRINLAGNRSPSFSVAGSQSRSIPLSSVSEQGPLLPSPPTPSVFDSRSLPNPSKLSLSPRRPAQQHPSRIGAAVASRGQDRAATEQETPRGGRHMVRRPSAHEQVTRRASPASMLVESHSSYRSGPVMVPSLYGGTVPRGLMDRIGSVSRSRDPSCTSSARSDSISGRAQQPMEGREDPFELESSFGSYTEDDRDEPDEFDASSDYHDVESTFSHVTTATLPPYEYGRRFSQATVSPPVPPVPAIPLAFRQHGSEPPVVGRTYEAHSLRSQPSFSSAMTLDAGRTNLFPPRSATAVSTASEADEFHGFRPRLGVAHRQHQGAAAFATPQQADRGNTALPSPGVAAPEQRLFGPAPAASAELQPHSYILGADGRPIPVYASLPSPSATSAPQPSYYRGPESLAPVTRQPLAVHSQPLEFDHSIHVNPVARQTATATAAAARPLATLSIPSASASASSRLVSPRAARATTTLSYTSYALAAPDSFPQPPHPPAAAGVASYPLHSNPNLPPPVTLRPPSTTPSTASTSTTASSSHRTPSTLSHHHPRWGALAVATGKSLRTLVQSPHVRFKSPEPSIAESSSSSRLRRREGQGDVNLDEEDGGRGPTTTTTTAERNTKAMQQSLGMLM